MSGWAWFAATAEVGDGAARSARARALDGGEDLVLSTWPASFERHPDGALRIGAAVLGDDGPAMAVSLARAGHVRPIFDDPAVVEAARAVLRRSGVTAFSTLTSDPVHLDGALTATERPWDGWWDDDPYARLLGGARRLEVEAGFLAAVPLPGGPGHQRYAGVPWPWGRFRT